MRQDTQKKIVDDMLREQPGAIYCSDQTSERTGAVNEKIPKIASGSDYEPIVHRYLVATWTP